MTRESVFVCQQCGEDFPKWMGRCSNCGEWNSLVETKVFSERKRGRVIQRKKEARSVKLAEVISRKTERISTKISELDRVLGGGLVLGQVVLLAGVPGIGKSTILLQVAEKLGKVLYVTGEESAEQIKLRANRLGVLGKGIEILNETDIDVVVSHKMEANLVIVDSIQTMSTSDLTGVAGSVGQVRECASRLVRMAKNFGVPVVMVGHATKSGVVAGPATLTHVVDTVLWFEGEREHNMRVLRATKNRFGSTDEIGVFSMEEKGLLEVTDASRLFLGDRRIHVPGSVVGVTLEGTRAMLVEIQSLVVKTSSPYPKRVSQGIDPKRLEMILAVLARRVGLSVYSRDVFVNVVGGLTLRDPGIDLAVALSVSSAMLDKAFPSLVAVVGEVGLLGEIRSVVGEKIRIEQAKRQGFSEVVGSRHKSLRRIVEKYIK